MVPSAQLLIAAVCPPKVTAPVLPPRLLPLIVTTVPAAPLVGLRPLSVGASTVNAEPLLCKPPAVTTTLPFVAPFGTTAVMPELVQFEVAAVSPLNVTVPVVPVKLLPAIAMGAPGSPVGGVNNVILGGGSVTV